jgi:hypothetical protein
MTEKSGNRMSGLKITDNSVRSLLKAGAIQRIVPDGNPSGRAPVWLCDGTLHVPAATFEDYEKLKAQVFAEM